MQDLFREINSNSRFVAACVRSLEKENSAKANIVVAGAAAVDEQPKSLDYSEHDSLVSTITTTSTESKRSENVLKPNALERRYHLLYLRVFEIQCTFEGLLEKRNAQLLSEEFRQQATDTSDEEPIAKIPKFNFDSNFISHKTAAAAEDDNDTPSDEKNTINSSGTKQLEVVECEADGDADFEDSEEDEDDDEGGEMECFALKSSDCVDSIIVPVKKSLSPKLKESPAKDDVIVETPKVNRRPKDFSKFNRSNRKSKNCAIFYYKHIDTDNDQLNNDDNDDGKESEPTTVSSEDEEVWEYSNVNNINNNNNGINETEIAATISDDKIADDTKLDNCLPEITKINDDDDSAKCPSSQQYLFSNVSNTSKVSFFTNF